MNIVYSSSDEYAKCTGVSLYSLLCNNKDLELLSIYILTSDMTEKNKKIISNMCDGFNRYVCFIDVKEKLLKAQQQFGLKGFKGGLNTYARAFANQLLPTDIDDVLFIDSDTLVSGSLKNIEEYDMSQYITAGVYELMLLIKSVCYEDQQLIDKCKNYINCGVVYVNLKKWREVDGDKILEKSIALYGKPFRIAEQSIVNNAFSNMMGVLPLEYNYYTVLHEVDYKTVSKWYRRKKTYSEQEFNKASENPKIIHFVGDYFNRPWYKDNICRYNKLYMQYYKKTPWGNSPLEEKPDNISTSFKIYYAILIFLRKHHFDNAYFYLRYVLIQWLREKIPNIDKIRRTRV